ncbi:MAG: Holliday junction branch migration DNA helicase RuvB [Planctomycetes bacterium]|nr:Holliday junction branch migration DNA helicase RuvB [Planctomycetota bacterium]
MPAPRPRDDEKQFDAALRPTKFTEFVGQKQVVDNLKIFLKAARDRGEPVDHVLLSGQPGLGKTTLAALVAHEMGAPLVTTAGPALERAGDLAGLLTRLDPGSILFVDEIHRLPAVVEEYLYSAMEDRFINIVLDSGPHARTMKLDVPPFTLVGATTREGLLSDPFRARFGVLLRLEPYPDGDLVAILERSAGLLAIALDPAGAGCIARRSQGTPRLANRYLRRVRDFAQVEGSGAVTAKVAEAALERLGIDSLGLVPVQRQILEVLSKHGGGPLGLKTIGAYAGEEEITLEEVYEPFLIRLGFLKRTPRGRVATEEAFRHLGIAKREQNLF